ncbi:MAG: hypothetical protein ACOH2K_15285 [Burkholderiaceae bacterium]
MSSSTTKFSALRLIVATVFIISLCAGTAVALVGWTPGASGLPSDIAAVEE